MNCYDIYGAGDAGSAEIVTLFRDMNLPYHYKDLRDSFQGLRRNLIHLIDRRLRTVPQVFAPDGSLIGDYEATIRYLETK